MELFVESLLTKTLQITNSRNAKTLTPSHMKQCILSESRFDFLRDLVKNIPDIGVSEENCGTDSPPTPSDLITPTFATSILPDAVATASTSSSPSPSLPYSHPTDSSITTLSIDESVALTSSSASINRAYSKDAQYDENLEMGMNGGILNYSMNRLTRSDSQPVNTLNFYKEISDTMDESIDADIPLPKLSRLNSAPPLSCSASLQVATTASQGHTTTTTAMVSSHLPLVRQNSDGSFNINISSIPKMKTSSNNNHRSNHHQKFSNKSDEMVYDYSIPSTSKSSSTNLNNNHKNYKRKNTKYNNNTTINNNSSSFSNSATNRTSTCTITSNDINKLNSIEPIIKLDYSNLIIPSSTSTSDSIDATQLTPTIKIDFSHLNNFTTTTPHQTAVSSFYKNSTSPSITMATTSKVIASASSSPLVKTTITTSCSSINKLDEDYDDL